MKRFSVLALLVVLVMGFAGTAMAAENTANLADTTTIQRVSRGPVVIQNASGAGTTLYVATGNGQFAGLNPLPSGVSVYAVDTARTNPDGTMQKKELTGAAASAMQPYSSGATLVGAPVVTTKAGAGTSVFYMVYPIGTQVVGSAGTGFANATNSGVSIVSLNGQSGAINWVRGIAFNGAIAGATAAASTQTTPLTLDDESVATSGATLYVGVGVDNTSNSTGATVYAIDGDDGSVLGQFAFPGLGAASFKSTVSGFYSAPFISGTSLYILGWDRTSAGVTLFGLNRNNLAAGVSAAAVVNTANMDFSHMQAPTPCVAGNSIFVVAAGTGTQAGVTVYDRFNLTKQYFVNYGPIAAGAGVSASPVSDGSYIVLSTLTAVTNYALTSVNGLSANKATWTIDLAKSFTDGTYNIIGTPAISNGFVYIPVADVGGGNKGFLLRCTLSSTTGNAIKLGSITGMVVADPIISVGYVYAVTYNPTVYQIDGSVGAVGFTNWQQFKFDKAKTGYNFNPPHAQPIPADDDSNCFISTVK